MAIHFPSRTPGKATLPLLAGACLVAFLTACGGSGSNSPNVPPAPTPIPIAGIWSGSITSTSTGQPLQGQALVLPNGALSFFTNDLTTDLTGSLTALSSGVTLANGTILQTSVTDTTLIKLESSITISNGTATANASLGFNFNADAWPGFNYASGNLALQYAPTLNVPVQLGDLQGSYTAAGTSQSAKPISLTLDAGGRITDPTGIYAGSLTQVGPDLNAFRVIMNRYSADPFNGVAFFIPAVSGPSPAPARLWLQTETFDVQLSRQAVP